MKTDEKPIWIYTALTALLMTPVVLVLGLIIGSHTSSKIDLATWTGALATVTIAFLTFFLAAETWRLRLSQNAQIEEIRKESIRPLIEIFIEQSSTNFQIFNLKVENVGKGIAKDISFELVEREDPLSESEKYLLNKLNSISFFNKKISVLGVSKSRSSFLFSFRQLMKNSKVKTFEACLLFKIVCHDSEGVCYTTSSVIDLSEFEGISQVGVNPAYESYLALKNISKNMESIASGKRLNMTVHTPTDQELEREIKFNEEVDEHICGNTSL